MKASLTIALGAWLSFTAVGRADDPAQAVAVVDQAIAASCGAEKLAALNAGIWKTSGVFRGQQSRAEFQGELPDKFRIDSTRVVDGKTVNHSRIISGTKGWVVEDGKVTPMTEEELKSVRESYYHKQLATTLVPLKHKDCKLSFEGIRVLNERPASVVKATRTGYPDVTLYFDRDTGLLAKTEMAQRSASGKDVQVELFFSQFREFDGIKIATRTKALHDGKPFLETEITEFKAVKKLPEEVFRP
jgi:hypothetical protein